VKVEGDCEFQFIAAPELNRLKVANIKHAEHIPPKREKTWKKFNFGKEEKTFKKLTSTPE